MVDILFSHVENT